MTTGVNNNTAAGAASGSSSSNSMSQLSSNFDTFLQLLTTQLQHQDPLEPDGHQPVHPATGGIQPGRAADRHQHQSADPDLAGHQQSAAYATGYLGKTVTVSGGEGSLTNGSAQWTYNLGAAATSTTLQVTDASGNVVYTGSGKTTAGNNTFNWNGEDNNGNQLPDGSYTLAVKASAGGQTVTTSVTAVGTVSEVNMINGTPQLLIGSMEVPLIVDLERAELNS